MKQIKLLVVFVFCAVVLCSGCLGTGFLLCGCLGMGGGTGGNSENSDNETDGTNNGGIETEAEEGECVQNQTVFLKGAWVPTVYNITYPAYPTQNSAVLKQGIDDIVASAQNAGLNALFFQVRPCADSLYKSKYFPWSKYLSGGQGVSPNNNFDPLAYIIERCHSAGLKLHAWINPYRITALSTDKIIPSHPASVVPEITFNAGGKLYFNPGELAARDLIIAGVSEIVENYDVDGIQFDDYFYPENMADEDLFTFNGSSNGINNLADWRRNNIDELIQQTYLAIKSIKPDVLFGVSPSGVWANKFNNPLGSDTWGFESYSEIYADSRGWVKKGYVDYIAPQLYWYIGQTGSDFITTFNWWRDVVGGTDTALYIGLAGYKQDDTWKNSTEITNQANLAANNAGGIIVYNFNDLQKPSVWYAVKNSG